MSATLKTLPTDHNVSVFLNSAATGQKLQDCLDLVKIMEQLTGKKPQMWGTSIVGFGKYVYHYSSGKSGEWPVVGFSPRKQNLTLYIMSGFGDYMDKNSEYVEIMKKLGKYKTGKSCLYVQKLEDIDLEVLKILINKSIKYMKENYETDLGAAK